MQKNCTFYRVERFAKIQTIFRKMNIIVIDNHSLWPINALMRVRTMEFYCIQNNEGNNPWLDSEGGGGQGFQTPILPAGKSSGVQCRPNYPLWY